MWSRTWCFNRTLFRKNLTRFWPLWAMASFLAALPPIMMAVELVRQRGDLSMTPLDITAGYYSALSGVVPAVLLVYAVVCAMAVWSYLFTARSVGLMHTLPISRKGLFLTNFLSGFAMVLIPFVVCGALCVVTTACFGLLAPKGLAVTVLGVLGMALFYFASATVCAFLTGNAFAMPAFYFVFHFLAVTLESLLSALTNLCLFGLSGFYGGVAEWLSPTVWLSNHLQVDRTWKEVTEALPHGSVTENVLASVKLENAWAMGAYALAGVALLLCAWILYRRRPSECAGDVVAVQWMRPFFRYGVAFLAALAGGQGLYFLFWYDWTAWSAAKLGLCMLLAGVMGFYIASMLLSKSLRVFRGSWRGPVVVAVASAVVCLGLRFDVLGLEKRVPELSEIQALELEIEYNTYTLTPGAQEALLQQALELHQAVVADRDYIREWQNRGWSSYTSPEGSDSDRVSSFLRYVYTLTDGTKLERQYTVPITRERLTQSGTYETMMDALVNNTDMKYLRIHMNASGSFVDGWEPDSVWVHGAASGGLDGSSRDARVILAALAKDIAAGSWGNADWFDDHWEETYTASVDISYARPTPGGYLDSDSITIALRPEMTNTLSALRRLHLIQNGDLITNGALDEPEGGYEEDESAWQESTEPYGVVSAQPPRVRTISLDSLRIPGIPSGTLVTLEAARK